MSISLFFSYSLILQRVGTTCLQTLSSPLASVGNTVVFDCNYCHSKHHQFGGLKQDNCIISQFCRSEIWDNGLDGFTALGLTRLESRYQLVWELTRRLWGRICFQIHSGCWPDSVPFDCGTEVPDSLPAVSQGWCSAAKGRPHPLAWGSLHLQCQQWWVKSFSCSALPLCLIPLTYCQGVFLLFKGLCDEIRHNPL